MRSTSGSMARYIGWRIFSVIPTVIGVVTVVFLLLRLIPGDPAEFILGDYATTESLARLRAQMGLDQPLYKQYAIFMARWVQGDWGRSLISKQPAFKEVLQVFPYSIHLAVSGVVIATILGIPLGIISAVRQRTGVDYAAMGIALFGVSMPVFWTGLVSILLFSYYVHVFPATGLGNPDDWFSMLHHLILPAGTLGLASTAYIARLTRSAMLEVIRQDYIRTARAKGLMERLVITRHALRNALIPVLSLIGLTFGWALGSSILIEAVFSRPGLGLLLIKAIDSRDYPVVQAGVALLAISFVLINVLIDLLFVFIDPRIRYTR